MLAGMKDAQTTALRNQCLTAIKKSRSIWRCSYETYSNFHSNNGSCMSSVFFKSTIQTQTLKADWENR